MKNINTISAIAIFVFAAAVGSCERETRVNQSQSENEPRTGQLQHPSPSQTQVPAAAPLAPERTIAPWKVVHTTSVTSSDLSFALAKAAWPDDFERREFYSTCARFAAEYGEWANPSFNAKRLKCNAKLTNKMRRIELQVTDKRKSNEELMTRIAAALLFPSLFIGIALAQTTTPYAIKTFTVGVSPLSEFKATFNHCADSCNLPDKKRQELERIRPGLGQARIAPFCSDGEGNIGNVGNIISPEEKAAGKIMCQPYFPFEHHPWTIAEVDMTQSVFFFFKGTLYSIDTMFASKDFPTLQGSFTEKFGGPTTSSAVEYQNAYGAKFTGSVLVWDNVVSTITLSQYAGSRDSSSLVILHKELGQQADASKPKPSTKDM